MRVLEMQLQLVDVDPGLLEAAEQNYRRDTCGFQAGDEIRQGCKPGREFYSQRERSARPAEDNRTVA